jgi:hypothetical protein
MPGMDGTGPRGLGPMTGGGRGWCNPYFGGIRLPFIAGNPYVRPYSWGFPYGYGIGRYVPYSPYVQPLYMPYIPFGWGRGLGRGWWW